jgi:hypothetical protein
MRSTAITVTLLAVLFFGSIPTYADTIVAAHINEGPQGGGFLLSSTDYTLSGGFGGGWASWASWWGGVGDAAPCGFDYGGQDVGGTGFAIIDGTRYDFIIGRRDGSIFPSAHINISAPPVVIGGAGLYSGPFTLTGRFHGTFFDDPIPWHTDIQGEFTGTGIATLTVIPSAPQPDGSPGFKVTGISYEFTTSVPEPSSILLLCIGLGAVGLIVWRRGN